MYENQLWFQPVLGTYGLWSSGRPPLVGRLSRWSYVSRKVTSPPSEVVYDVGSSATQRLIYG